EVRVAQPAAAVEVVGGHVGAQHVGDGTQPFLHVADGLELAERLQPRHEGLGQDDHDEDNQGHRDQQFHQRECLSPSHGMNSESMYQGIQPSPFSNTSTTLSSTKMRPVRDRAAFPPLSWNTSPLAGVIVSTSSRSGVWSSRSMLFAPVSLRPTTR